MNNQAAQTMLEPVTVSMCPSSDYAKGWNDCLAALSQTAGVVADQTHFALSREAMQRFNDLLAAAPAASGGEDDMCPNCVTPWKCNGPHESTGGASASERARFSKQAHDMLIDLRAAASIGRPITGDELHELEQDILRALEQALTQQRGEVAWTHDAESWGKALNEAAWVFVEQCPEKSALLFNNTKAPLRSAILKYAELVGAATTPQPSADAVREDSARLDWIESQIREYGDGYTEPREAGWGIQWQQERPYHYWPGLRAWIDEERRRASGDELESLLSAASGEGVDDTKRLDWIARQGGYEFDFGILNDQPGDGDWFVHGMVGSGQGATFRDAIDAAIKEEAGGQDANTDILDTLAFKTENGDAGRGSVTYIALVASGEADHQQNAAQGGGAS